MVQNVSLHGVKAHSLARTHKSTHEQDTVVKYLPPDLKFLSQLKGESTRAPVHEDFNAFLESTTAQINEKISDAIKMATTIQSHRFGTESDSLQKNNAQNKAQTVLETKPDSKQYPDKHIRIPLTDTPRLLEVLNSAPIVQTTRQINDRGYSSRMATDPLITLVSASDRTSMGLVGAIQAQLQHENSGNDFHEFSEKSKTLTKVATASRNEHASLLRREEIEMLRDVKEKFQQQLNTQYPHITVPIKHPNGIVDIHMRFDRKIAGHDGTKGAVRVLFSGSNAEVIALFAQHREEFMNVITKEGYAIDPYRMQFNGPSVIESI